MEAAGEKKVEDDLEHLMKAGLTEREMNYNMMLVPIEVEDELEQAPLAEPLVPLPPIITNITNPDF